MMRHIATRFRIDRYVPPAHPAGKGTWAFAVAPGSPMHECYTKAGADMCLAALRRMSQPGTHFRLVEVREFTEVT